MQKKSSIRISAAVSGAAAALLCIWAFGNTGTVRADGNQVVMPPPYNPYPPGILPKDIVQENLRVKREVDGIEEEAIAQWKALTPPVLTNQPPVLQNTGQEANIILGKLMNFDVNMSPFRDRACASCHMPYAGFSGPIQSVNLTMIAYPGSYDFRANKRSAQRYTYSPYFPVLSYNLVQGLFFGGEFWDSRATGYRLGSPDQEQAQGPPVDTGEQMLSDSACIAFRLSTAVYLPLFETIWGAFPNINWPSDTEKICDTPGGASIFNGSSFPINLSPSDRTSATNIYAQWGESINQYEISPDLSAFSSKFDAFLKGSYTLTADEMAGYQLFNGKGNCNSCHLDGRSTLCAAQTNGCSSSSSTLTDTGTAADTTPVFTCFGSANEGLPLNPRNSYYYETKPDIFGFTPNPDGFGYRDLGIGSMLRSVNGTIINGTWASPNSTWTQYAPSVDGQFQVMSARDVGMVPPQCGSTEAGSGPYFQKEFFHNGYIKSLKQLVHFYNTRDVYPYNVTSGHCPAGTVEKVTCWPLPEVNNMVDTTTGKLGLTDQEENQIVAFLMTLTDGYTRPYPDINTYTGKCFVCDPSKDPNCSPSKQGNGSLIPTPPLPACSPAICNVPPVPNPGVITGVAGQ